MRYFARLTNNKEYILLYTNLILSDSRKKDSDSRISTLYHLFTDFAAIPISRVYVVNAEPLVFAFHREDADAKSYQWVDLVEELLLIFSMHIDKQELGEFVEEPQLEKDIKITYSEESVFKFELDAYKFDYEITDEEAQFEVIAKHCFNEGKLRGATHLFIIDEYKNEEYTYIYVYPSEDPLYMYYLYNTDENMEVSMVYFLYKQFEDQLFEIHIHEYNED